MGLFSWWHILLVLVVLTLLFGAGRVSGLMAEIAKGLKTFKRGMAEDEDGARSRAQTIEYKRSEEGSAAVAEKAKTSKRARKAD
jgi:sec-independent protein translocase protein TatA